MTQMQDRIDDYLRFGVKFVWVVDPRTRRAFIYTSDTVSGGKRWCLADQQSGDCGASFRP